MESRIIYAVPLLTRWLPLERCNCFKVNGGPQLEANIWQVLIGLESETEASIKQPQTEIKCNMLVAD